MKLILIAADYEENLGIGLIAAAVLEAGHSVQVLPYNNRGETQTLLKAALKAQPNFIGLSMQFQHRGEEFLELAKQLRERGFKGHLSGGGQFASLAWEALLDEESPFDSLVLHEGERSVVELLEALEEQRSLDELPGLALPRPARRSPGRPIESDLDALPRPFRYRKHSKHLGVDFIPVMGSRGCWGRCSFCSISSFHRAARCQGGGAIWRERSVENIADEIAELWHKGSGRAIFCFHDDTLLRPRPQESQARLSALRAALDIRGVGPEVALVGKCRPDNLSLSLALELRKLGMIRLYVGVENSSKAGAAHLARSSQTAQVDQALSACREAGIFVCYNLLIFEPETQLSDVQENIDFIRRQAEHPINFCRAEPYSGTPMYAQLKAQGRLRGSHLAWNYRISDARSELLFRITSAAFRQRNFDTNGVANRYMGLGYAQQVAEFFFPDPEGRLPTLRQRSQALTQAISLETADFLEEALRFVQGIPLHNEERIVRFSADLGLRIAKADRLRHQELDALYGALQGFVAEAKRPSLLPSLRKLARPLALSASLLGAVACDPVDPAPSDMQTDDAEQQDEGLQDHWVVDPLPPDVMVVDPPPPDAMVIDPAPQDAWIVDPPPIDAMVVDPPPPDAWIVDPPPPDAMVADPAPQDAWIVDPPPPDAWIVDPPPVDAMVVDPLPPDAGVSPKEGAEAPIDQWRESSNQHFRSRDLPLFAPPRAEIKGEREGESLRLFLKTQGAVSTTWRGEGRIEGDGLEISWWPEHPDDQIRVAIRSTGGVMIKAHRARDFE